MSASTFLAASLLDPSAKRLSVALAMRERVAAPAERNEHADETRSLFVAKGEATAESFLRGAPPAVARGLDGDEPAPLFFAKGDATAEQFLPTAETPVESPAIAAPTRETTAVVAAPLAHPRSRLSLRVAPEQRLRVQRAAAALGQTSQAFMREAVDRFLGSVTLGLVAEPPRPSPLWVRPIGMAFKSRVKLTITVEAEQHESMRAAAARLGRSLQSCLTQALQQHLSDTLPEIARRAAAERERVLAANRFALPRSVAFAA